jgi:DNA-directed RNA polymerase specialized sigma24 family protein
MSENFDAEILDKIRKGEQASINLIKKPLKNTCMTICRKYGIKNYGLADEIVHEVLIEISLSKKVFAEPFNVLGYLHTITDRLICRHLRENFKYIDGGASPAAFTAGPASMDLEIELYEISDATDVCLGYLTNKEQQLMEGILDDLSPENLAEKLDYKNLNVFYSRKSLVIPKFRELLRKHGLDM